LSGVVSVADLETLEVAVVGLGVGEQHVRAFAAHPGCHVRWLYDLDAARSQRLAPAVGAMVAEDYDAILSDAATGLVSIASFDDAHFEQTRMALEAGKHVFVEKPLCRDHRELSQLKQAWAAHGRRAIASNLVLRSAPLYKWLKAAIDGGELGEVYAFDGDYLYGRLEKITDGWRSGVEDYSVMAGGGVHLVDLMLWLTGQRPASVTAVGNRICSRGTAFRYNDFAAATFVFPGGRDGLVGRITANFGCVHRHHHVVRVFGTKGTFIYDDVGARVHRSKDAGASAEFLTESPLPGSKGDLIPPFVDAIRAGTIDPAAAQHDFDVISACLGADAAIREMDGKDIEYV
jgi:predicted dehydrogenase